MYAVSIIGLDREGNEHCVDIPAFKYTDTISCVINHAIDDITDAPWFCIVDSVTIENTETSLMQTFELYTSNKEKSKIEVYSLVKGWITRDARIIPEKKTVLDNNEESFDPHKAGFKLLLEYFMMAPEEQVKRHSDYAQLIASLISGHME
jgi:hypothetical protein